MPLNAGDSISGQLPGKVCEEPFTRVSREQLSRDAASIAQGLGDEALSFLVSSMQTTNHPNAELKVVLAELRYALEARRGV